MLCTTPLPPASPAGSEISVGAPSPPPATQTETRRGGGGEDYFRPLKKLKGIGHHRERSVTPPSRSSLEGVKSFSIADILGRDAEVKGKTEDSSPPLHHLHQPTKIVRPWDHLRGPVHAVRPFLPPALLHYEHRLALDYQRHLEHLNAQAQLFRQMTMGAAEIIKSESGSERSSSVASDCCSPEIGSNGSRLSEHHHQSQSSNSPRLSGGQHHSQKTKPNGTPLDALFQMTNKNFDESQGDEFTGTFDVVICTCRRNGWGILDDFLINIFCGSVPSSIASHIVICQKSFCVFFLYFTWSLKIQF